MQLVRSRKFRFEDIANVSTVRDALRSEMLGLEMHGRRCTVEMHGRRCTAGDAWVLHETPPNLLLGRVVHQLPPIDGQQRRRVLYHLEPSEHIRYYT